MKRLIISAILISCAAVAGGLLFARALLGSASPGVVPEAEKTVKSEILESDSVLQSQTDALLALFDAMPPVPVYLKNERVVKTGSRTGRGVAYTACDLDNNPTIFIKQDFFRRANQKQLENILKHELTHAYFCRQGRMWGHDDDFQRKFKEVGGFGN